MVALETAKSLDNDSKAATQAAAVVTQRTSSNGHVHARTLSRGARIRMKKPQVPRRHTVTVPADVATVLEQVRTVRCYKCW